MTSPPSSAGRPRDPQKDVDVLQAARELLVEDGYQATTIVAVARRAGVGAPTIYRRWANREALIEDAAFGQVTPDVVPDLTGNLRTDIRSWVLIFLNRLANPVARAAIPGLMLAYQQDDGLYERLVARTEFDVRLLMRGLLEAHLPIVADRDLHTRVDAVFDFLVATTAIRALTVGLTGHEAFCDTTADALTALAKADWPFSR